MTRLVTTTFVPRGAPVSSLAAQAEPAAAQPKPGAPAPKPSPAPAPVQAPRALPRTGEAGNWLLVGLGAASTILLGVGLVARRRGM